ncbi:hypothetical protein BHU24_08095 [Bacillus pseudomycoides]|uniref:DUF4274 domain-containing protein n=2 Tax=Bacillus pseudomycoides TaxID=64104 RepID=A0ABD6T907_9BACI|nr:MULTISPECIES: DUF4274 domain-containing protein [Bacillus]MBD5796503.1 hypothetical protein [Bacillus pseudomycoides]MBJ8026966.1 DUF4274 domain-containing protein [Bacillus cereus group sp. N21]MCR8859230.1 DUF4274 domain-containing protein [Bacillus pseudomycoides]MED1622038.1 DUF4274 domain-containing protein [Bacillus pseudomycoides]PDZ12880.1 DUF4274 domain-containing protein [Bacillus pseudomycoides]
MNILFEAIKSKNLEKVIGAMPKVDINEQDQFGRTSLHYVIVKKAPIEIFKELLAFGAKTGITDRLHESVLTKAIKFNNKQAVKCLIENGVELNHPAGIKKTPWFLARHNPEIADLLLETKGAIRLKLTESEQAIIDGCLYGEPAEVNAYLTQLNTPELLHAFVLHFNWDDDLQPMKMVLQHANCQEITAIEMFDLVDGDYWLNQGDSSDEEREYVDFVQHLLRRFPNIL